MDKRRLVTIGVVTGWCVLATILTMVGINCAETAQQGSNIHNAFGEIGVQYLHQGEGDQHGAPLYLARTGREVYHTTKDCRHYREDMAVITASQALNLKLRKCLHCDVDRKD